MFLQILCLAVYIATATAAGYPKSNGYSYTPPGSKAADYNGNGGGNGNGKGGGSDIPILKYESNINPDGSYNVRYFNFFWNPGLKTFSVITV